MSNSVDPDETAHNEPSDLDLRGLQKPIIIACGSEKVNKSLNFPRDYTSEIFKTSNYLH